MVDFYALDMRGIRAAGSGRKLPFAWFQLEWLVLTHSCRSRRDKACAPGRIRPDDTRGFRHVTIDVRTALVLLPMAAVFLLAACSDRPNKSADGNDLAVPGPDFNYISVSDGRVRTLHELKYEISIAGDFSITEPKNRIDVFGNTPYRISLAAFIGEDSALMIHAEEVADSSGASDYSHLSLADWPDGTFRSSDPSCLHILPEEVRSEHDLQWLRENGFEPSGNIVYAQYFATTADMNTEIVISMLQHVGSCDDAFDNLMVIDQFQARTSGTRIE